MGDWNENRGGASRTERGKISGSPTNLSPRILDRSRATGKPEEMGSVSAIGYPIRDLLVCPWHNHNPSIFYPCHCSTKYSVYFLF